MPVAAAAGADRRTGVHADITEEVRGSSDLLALATPTRLSAIAPRRRSASATGSRAPGDLPGHPPLLVVALVVARRRSPLVRVGSPCCWSAWCSLRSAARRRARHPGPVALGGGRVAAGAVAHGPVPAGVVHRPVRRPAPGGGAGEPVEQRPVGHRVLAVATAVLVLAFLVPPAPLHPGRRWPRRRSSPPRRCPRSAGRGRPRGPVPPEGTGQPGDGLAGAGRYVVQDGGWLVGPGPNGGTLREAPPTTTSPALDRDPAGRAPPRPDAGPAPADRRGPRPLAGRLGGGPGPDAAPPGQRLQGFLTDLLGRLPNAWPGSSCGARPRWRHPPSPTVACVPLGPVQGAWSATSCQPSWTEAGAARRTPPPR